MRKYSTKVYETKSYFLLLKFCKRSTSERGRAGRWTVQEAVAGDAHEHGAEKRLPPRVVVQVLLSEQAMLAGVLGKLGKEDVNALRLRPAGGECKRKVHGATARGGASARAGGAHEVPVQQPCHRPMDTCAPSSGLRPTMEDGSGSEKTDAPCGDNQLPPYLKK